LKTTFKSKHNHHEFIVVHFGVTNGFIIFMDYMKKIVLHFLD